MNRQFLKAAVAGGDTRQVYLAEALGENGFLVKTYGLPKDPGHSQVKKASSLRGRPWKMQILSPLPSLF